jgi:hypothetical protein
MELYLPSLAVFFLVIFLSFVIIPKFSPIILASLSAVLLTIGIYHHWSIFKNEYRLSTWQEPLKIYAPGVFIIAVAIFTIYVILVSFTGGEVPVPSLPTVPLPEPNTVGNIVATAINNIGEKFNNATKAVANVATDAVNAVKNATEKATNVVANMGEKKENNVTRSFLKVV